MAESKPATLKVTLTNVGSGPRSFFTADGDSRILRPGESAADVEVLEAELSDANFSPDIRAGDPAKVAAEAAKAGEPTPGEPTPGEPTPTGGEAAIQAEAAKLEADNSKAELVALAEAEGVTIETDDNKADIAGKIAHSRAAGGGSGGGAS